MPYCPLHEVSLNITFNSLECRVNYSVTSYNIGDNGSRFTGLHCGLRQPNKSYSTQGGRGGIFCSDVARLANRPGMDEIVLELTHGVPCPGRGSFCPGNVKIDHWT